MTLRVVAHVRAQEGKEAELGAALQELVEPTRREAANITYELLVSVDDPRDFTFIETWTNADGLRAHSKTPHMQAARSKLAALIEGSLDVRIYTTVA
jgi:quinol monooxygenase YgiN